MAKVTGAFDKKQLPQRLARWTGSIETAIKAAAKGAESIQNLRTMDAAFVIAQAHLRVPDDAWDRDAHLLLVHNGVVDLRTGALHAPSPQFRMTRSAGCKYDPAASAPMFEDFLRQMQPDPEVRKFLQRLIGYAATGEAREQKYFTFIGGGNNGKGTFIRLMMAALGGYAAKANAGLLAEQAPDKPRDDVAGLAGARLLSISELPANLRADAALIKSLTGGDLIKARFLYKEYFEFLPCFTPIIDTNHPLVIRETGAAIDRRRITIPWPTTIPEDKEDKYLEDRLRQELPGILTWIVEGAGRYYADGLGSLRQADDSSLDRAEPYETVTRWFGECADRDPASRVRSSDLYGSYNSWAKARGIASPVDSKTFKAGLEAAGITSPQKSNGVMVWVGGRLHGSDYGALQ